MEEESECIHGILMSYLNKRKGNKIFLFFEGNDDSKYYIQRIAMHIKEREVVKYICECKKNVLKRYCTGRRRPHRQLTGNRSR